MIVELSHPEFWIQLGRIRDTPSRWHEYDWGHSFFYRYLVTEMARAWWMNVPPYLYQIEPNLRINKPHASGIPEHMDADFGHQAEEMNVWIPLTDLTHDSQRLWVYGDGWEPVDVKLGQAFIFQGSTILHASLTNTTDTERRSMDFRLIRTEDYEDTGATTVEYHVPMDIGHYWKEA